jgi:hypothetical protein
VQATWVTVTAYETQSGYKNAYTSLGSNYGRHLEARPTPPAAKQQLTSLNMARCCVAAHERIQINSESIYVGGTS